MSSESNYRFERKVDAENVLFASCRAAYLYKEICKGNTDEPFLEVNYIKSGTRIIQFNMQNYERIIGMNVPATKVKSILQSLGFSVNTGKGKNDYGNNQKKVSNDVSFQFKMFELK